VPHGEPRGEGHAREDEEESGGGKERKGEIDAEHALERDGQIHQLAHVDQVGSLHLGQDRNQPDDAEKEDEAVADRQHRQGILFSEVAEHAQKKEA